MNILGLNFTKISAERSGDVLQTTVNTNIEFLEVEKEKLEILKDAEPLRVKYLFSITYNKGEGKKQEKVAEIIFEGTLLLSATLEESKEVLKSWKKKELSNNFKVPLFNLILKKCSIRALALEEELGIPSHVPLPRLQPKQQ